MKKLLLSAAFAVITLTSFAQDFWSDGGSATGITFGITAGASISSLRLNSMDKESISSNSISSGVLGVNVDFRFNNYFSIRPGLSYIGKGGKLSSIASDDVLSVPISYTEEYNLYYLEMPLNFIGHIPIGESSIFIGAGPYVAKGMSGSVKQTVGGSDPINQKIKFGSNGDFKSIDYGATSVFGFQAASGWAISANFDLGLTNTLQNNELNDPNSSAKTAALYFSIGKSF